MMYKTVAIAGTFDRLHKGHRHFISEAFRHGEKVVIGLTSNEFIKLKVKSEKSGLKFQISHFKLRKIELERYLEESGVLKRSRIVKIDDMYGPAVERDMEMEALVVTEETLKGGEEVNRKRKELGLGKLELLVVDMVPAEDKERISSTRIREGEIDRFGRLYKSKFQNPNDKSPVIRRDPAEAGKSPNFKFQINNVQRRALKMPQGILIKGDPENLDIVSSKLINIITAINPVMVITVGDEVTRFGNQHGVTANIAILDYQVNRKPKYKTLADHGFTKGHGMSIVKVTNPAGFISRELVSAVEKSVKNFIRKNTGTIIEVNGEDDLAGVPAILFAPLGSVVLYGQPGEGVVVVEITEKKKEELLSILI